MKIKEYFSECFDFTRFSSKREIVIRIIACIAGNIIIGLGVAVTKITLFGNDPFNGMCMSASDVIGIPYTIFVWIFNLTLFAAEIIWGRKYIHFGTFINWFLLAYAVSFFLPFAENILGYENSLPVRLLLLLAGILVSSFGLALYQYADLGVAPYDAVPLMVVNHFPKVKFFAARMALDCAAVAVIIICHGVIGIGTLINAVGLGPVVHVYTLFINKVVKKKAV